MGAVRGLLSDRSEALRVAREVERCRKGDDVERKRDDLLRVRRQAETDLDNLMAAIKAGMHHPAMQSEIEDAQRRSERATRDLALLDAESAFDAEDFADFLQWGTTLDDATILDAFVGQVIVFDDCAVATLNYDDEKDEPVRVAIDAERVRGGSLWWTVGGSNPGPWD